MTSTLRPVGLILAAALLTTAGCGGPDAPDATPGAVANVPEAAPGAAAGPSEETAKEFVRQTEERIANPPVVAVNFESVEFAEPRAPTEQDRIDGITSDTVYPARVRYTTTRRTTQGDEEVSSYNNYNFHQDGYGEWTATLPGPVR